MKKIILSLTALSLIGSGNVIAQQKTCGTDHRLQHLIQEDPSIEETPYFQEHSVTEDVQAVVTIPVVVHVVYRTAFQNVTQTQILSQITALNRDFRKTNADTTSIPSFFKPLAADTEIEFCLAQQDPNGNPTDGITRTSTTTAQIGNTNQYYQTSQGGHDAWPRDKYLNIWVVDIDGGSTLGFAYPPGSAGPTYDGVVIDYRFLGTTPNVSAPFNKGRTGTHEVGHFLNLQHIWGWGNCGDDFVSDTPKQQTANYGCPSAPRNPNACGITNPGGDMFMNYMDYVDDACMVMFTDGQKQRMHAALNSSSGQRSSLKTSVGCVPVSSVEERLAGPAFKLFPNPTSSVAYVVLEELIPGEVLSVQSLSGKTMMTLLPDRRTWEINTDNLSSGIYLVRYGAATNKLVITK